MVRQSEPRPSPDRAPLFGPWADDPRKHVNVPRGALRALLDAIGPEREHRLERMVYLGLWHCSTLHPAGVATGVADELAEFFGISVRQARTALGRLAKRGLVVVDSDVVFIPDVLERNGFSSKVKKSGEAHAACFGENAAAVAARRQLDADTICRQGQGQEQEQGGEDRVVSEPAPREAEAPPPPTLDSGSIGPEPEAPVGKTTGGELAEQIFATLSDRARYSKFQTRRGAECIRQNLAVLLAGYEVSTILRVLTAHHDELSEPADLLPTTRLDAFKNLVKRHPPPPPPVVFTQVDGQVWRIAGDTRAPASEREELAVKLGRLPLKRELTEAEIEAALGTLTDVQIEDAREATRCKVAELAARTKPRFGAAPAAAMNDA